MWPRCGWRRHKRIDTFVSRGLTPSPLFLLLRPRHAHRLPTWLSTRFWTRFLPSGQRSRSQLTAKPRLPTAPESSMPGSAQAAPRRRCTLTATTISSARSRAASMCGSMLRCLSPCPSPANVNAASILQSSLMHAFVHEWPSRRGGRGGNKEMKPSTDHGNGGGGDDGDDDNDDGGGDDGGDDDEGYDDDGDDEEDDGDGFDNDDDFSLLSRI